MFWASLFITSHTTPVHIRSQPLDFVVTGTTKAGYQGIIFENQGNQNMAKHNSLRGFVELIVLEMLSRGKLTNTYEIKLAIASESNGVLKIGDSTLYPAIERMKEKGWISTEANDKFYRRIWDLKMTKDGKKHLRSEKMSWRKFRSAVERILGA